MRQVDSVAVTVYRCYETGGQCGCDSIQVYAMRQMESVAVIVYRYML